MLKGSNLTVIRGGKRLLASVDAVVPAGKVVALIGPNGAGKTTLLSVPSGGMRPTQGDVWLDGRNLASWHANELARRRAVLFSTRSRTPGRRDSAGPRR